MKVFSLQNANIKSINLYPCTKFCMRSCVLDEKKIRIVVMVVRRRRSTSYRPIPCKLGVTEFLRVLEILLLSFLIIFHLIIYKFLCILASWNALFQNLSLFLSSYNSHAFTYLSLPDSTSIFGLTLCFIYFWPHLC